MFNKKKKGEEGEAAGETELADKAEAGGDASKEEGKEGEASGAPAVG